MKVYPNWAYEKDEQEKHDMNLETYEELRKKYKILRSCITENYNFDDYDIVIETMGSDYGSNHYLVHKNNVGLSNDELALLCDEGNLCFGYRIKKNRFIIYTD